MNVLFVCSRNRWRSPTAEQVFADYPGIVCASAGLTKDADTPLDAELVTWADVIFVMEPEHRTKLSNRFGGLLRNRQVVCLDIPDRYQYMDERLVVLLKAKVTPILERSSAGR